MEQEQTPTWKIRSLKEAYQDRPPTEYIVDRFFAAGSLNIVYGAPASMKSMLMGDLCAAIVAGQEWLPGSGVNGKGVGVIQSPIFWLDMDNGTRRTDQRIDALSRARELPKDAPYYYVSMPMPPFNVGDLDSLIYFKGLITELKARLVVIDNLGLITGEIEENSAGMAMVMGYLRQIAEGTNAAIIVIHHQRKGGAGGNSLTGDELRGHSSIRAAVDIALHVGREMGSQDIFLTSTKTRDVDVPNIGARFNYKHKNNTNDLQTAWFEGTMPKRGTNAIKEEIIECVDYAGKIGKTKLAQMVKDELGNDAPGINKIRAWIDDMIAVTGELTEIVDGRYRVIKLSEVDIN